MIKATNKHEFAERALRSFQRAVRKVYEERARQNETVSIWRDGKVQILPASELLLELIHEENTRQS
jgi:hypothetical protein